ncbi:RICIN domain-containing protein [Streptomyces sp. HUAS ZL42]|uniref:RICIN domain-containing protein n=1 Tax=Streptomyces sp. HUAS ZL42 TaxID=3231715 RepID=UPI00345F0198
MAGKGGKSDAEAALKDYQLAAVHSGKCVDVSEISTAAGAKIHQWTCDPASALSTKRNQIWRLQGMG